jgi:hypothetical protein
MSASLPRPHLWKARGVWWCTVVENDGNGLPWRNAEGRPVPIPDEPVGTGATPGEAGTVWRLVKHGQRFRTVA